MTLQGDKEKSWRHVPVRTSEAEGQAKLVSSPIWPPTSSVTLDKLLSPSRSEIQGTERTQNVRGAQGSTL